MILLCHRTWATWLFAILFLPALAMAGEKEDAAMTAKEKQLRVTYGRQCDAQVNKERSQQLRYLLAIVDQVDRTAELSDAQARKLSVAAKGAVERSIEHFSDEMQKYYDARIDRAMGRGRVNVRLTVRRGQDAAAEQSIWKATLVKVLDDEQRERYHAALLERAAYARSTLVDCVVVAIDERILLTESQREAMVKVVFDTLNKGSQKANRDRYNITLKNQCIRVLSLLDQKRTDKILTEAQRKQFAATRNVRFGMGTTFPMQIQRGMINGAIMIRGR